MKCIKPEMAVYVESASQKMLKSEAVPIQAYMYPYEPKNNLKISCDSPFKIVFREEVQ
jgi:hypothetical protein